jgi:hypothetical protein
MTTLAPPPTPSSAERAQGRAHPWRALAVSFLLGVSFVACTLTESDVQPPPIDSINPVQPGGDDEPPASRCQVDADCDSNRTCVASACRLAACLGSADVPRCELELCPAGACMADTCNDRQRNGNETDIDCGGGCLTCALAASCAVDVDCQSGSCAVGVCVEASCSDGRKNGGEAAVDCGGNCPLGCASGATCRDDADCSSRRCAAGVCVPAGCNDGQRNQDESDTDCGGTRCGPCPTGGTCAGDGDCAGGLFCTSARECASTTCADGSLNGGEILTDCGGGECPGCPSGTACSQGDDCQSDVCSGGVCASASCSDGTLNQDESDADCGGAVCEPCLDGLACDSDEDCESAVCGSASCDAAVPTCCQAPSCSDGVINGNEVVTDCGNAPCPLCADGHPCTQAAQCQSGSCADGVCSTLPACDDGAQNGSETDEDCGGSNACARCGDGDSCNAGSDCASGQCAGGVCISCSDGRQNGNETDIDCGGACGDCGPGLRCGSGADCQSGACAALNGVNRCCGGSGQHCTRCAEQLSANVDCSGAADPTGVGNCNAFLQCLANNSAICTTRNAAGCSGDPGGVCNHNSFGGDFGTGVSRANQVLTAAGCQL